MTYSVTTCHKHLGLSNKPTVQKTTDKIQSEYNDFLPEYSSSPSFPTFSGSFIRMRLQLSIRFHWFANCCRLGHHFPEWKSGQNRSNYRYSYQIRGGMDKKGRGWTDQQKGSVPKDYFYSIVYNRTRCWVSHPKRALVGYCSCKAEWSLSHTTPW